MTTFFDIIKQGERSLSQAGLSNSTQEAQWLCGYVFHKTTETLLRDLRDPIPNTTQYQQYQATIQERATGKPLAYITDSVNFLGEDYRVQPGVFIPRPETEELVTTIIETLGAWFSTEDTVTLLECGFGSGIISISVAKACPNATIIAWDLNPLAVETATKNAEAHHMTAIEWREGDFFEGIKTVQQQENMVIVSNPPYIPDNDIMALEPTVRDFEPHLALKGGVGGLDYYKRLILTADAYNCPLICEIGIHQEAPLKQLLNKKNWDAAFIKDYEGIGRILVGTPPRKT